jgi:hypothetical protein
MNKKEVGQILYILSQSDMNLIPVIVVEEMIRRTLDGEETTYAVEAMGRNGAKKRFNLSNESMKVFDDVEHARSFLVNNATDAINALCAEASSKGKLLRESTKRTPVKEQEKNAYDPVQEYDEVLLEDGTRVKISLPPGV